MPYNMKYILQIAHIVYWPQRCVINSINALTNLLFWNIQTLESDISYQKQLCAYVCLCVIEIINCYKTVNIGLECIVIFNM